MSDGRSSMELGDYTTWEKTGDAFPARRNVSPAYYEPGVTLRLLPHNCQICGAKFRDTTDCKVCDEAADTDEKRDNLFLMRRGFIKWVDAHLAPPGREQ